MLPGGYLFRVAYAFDCTLNALLAGNPDQTVSSRCYEAAVVKNISYWKPPYHVVNAGAYVVKWTIGRVLGYRFGVDMATNHCKAAYELPSIAKDNFHTYS